MENENRTYVHTVKFFKIQACELSHSQTVNLWTKKKFFFFWSKVKILWKKTIFFFLFTSLWTEIHRKKVTFTGCESVNEKKQKVLFWSKSENFAKKIFWFTDSQSRFTDSQTKFTVPEFLKILQCVLLTVLIMHRNHQKKLCMRKFCFRSRPIDTISGTALAGSLKVLSIASTMVWFWWPGHAWNNSQSENKIIS